MTFEPVIETLQGYRVLELGDGELRSLSADYTWTSGWNVATCGVRRRSSLQTSSPRTRMRLRILGLQDHGQGLRQFGAELRITVSPSGFGDFDSPSGLIFARVQIAGRLVVGTDGWHAERAGIVTLFAEEMSSDLLVPVAATYSVGVESMPEIDWPVQGLLTDLGDDRLRVLRLEGDRKFEFESFRIERGSTPYLAAMAAAGGKVIVEYERRDGDRWVMRVTGQEAEAKMSNLGKVDRAAIRPVPPGTRFLLGV